MATAIFGLIGVIIGGLIAALSSILVEARRDRKLEQRERKGRLGLLKEAARVLDAELEQAATSAYFVVKKRCWWPEEMGPIKIDSWNKYRAILASELAYEDWRTVVFALAFVEGINNARALAARKDSNSPVEPMLTDDGGNRIPFGIEGIVKARRCLRKLLSTDSQVT
jgi:gas vesicle protein